MHLKEQITTNGTEICLQELWNVNEIEAKENRALWLKIMSDHQRFLKMDGEVYIAEDHISIVSDYHRDQITGKQC